MTQPLGSAKPPPVAQIRKPLPMGDADPMARVMETRENMSTPPIMKHFRFEHLPTHLQDVSRPICELAEDMVATLPMCAELSAGLRKLLEAKDCLVRVREMDGLGGGLLLENDA